MRFLLLPLLLAAFAPAARARDASPAAPRVQAQAFALGYALRTADTRGLTFAQAAARLKSVDDDKLAGAEVAHLSRESVTLRRAQALAYTQAAALLARMSAPPPLRAWASDTAAALNAPPVFTGDAKDLAKTEPDTARVLAALAELRAVQAASNSRRSSLVAWLSVSGGRIAVWTAETGAYAADLGGAARGRREARPRGAARALLAHAPPDAPAPARLALADLLPAGGGNLQSLATLPPATLTPAKLTRAYTALVTFYGAARSADALDEAQGRP